MSHNDEWPSHPWPWHVPLDTVPPESAIVREMWELMQEALPEDAVDWANELMSTNSQVAGLPSATKTSPAKIGRDMTNVQHATEEVIEAMWPKVELSSQKTEQYSSRKRKQTQVFDPAPPRKKTNNNAPPKKPTKKLSEKDLRCHEKAVFALPSLAYPDKRFASMPLPVYSERGQRDRVTTFNNTIAWLSEKQCVKPYEENGSVKKIEVTDKPFFYKGMNMSLAADDRDFELSGSARETMRYMALYPTEKANNGNHMWGCSVFKEMPDLRRHTSAAVCTLPPASW